MGRIDDQTRQILEERDRFIEGQSLESPHPRVRPEVAASWRRSMACKVDPSGVRPDFRKLNADRLSAAAMPIIERSLESLSGTTTSILFADSSGRLIGRWSDDPSLRNALSHSYVEAGFSMAEEAVGANGIGTALEVGKVAEFHGPEHFSNQYIPFTCVGAPITHPITRQIVGAIDITCRYEDTAMLARSWITTLARQIEQQLLDGASVRERTLLSAYIRVSRRTKKPVLCLNDKLLISNSRASELIGELDQQLIWEVAQRVCCEEAAGNGLVTLPGGPIAIRCHAVRDEDKLVGAVIEFRPNEDDNDLRAGVETAARSAVWLPGLAGSSARWKAVCLDARRLVHSEGNIVVEGESGTGKLSLLRAVFDADAPISVLDCSLESLDGVRQWVGRLRDRMQNPEGLIVLAHLEALSVQAARAVCGLLDGHIQGAPRIAATMTTTREIPFPHDPLVDRLAVNRVAVPPLRDRSEDIPELIRVLSRRHSGSVFDRTWLPDTVIRLRRWSWPGNVRELETVLRWILNNHPSGYISVASLPVNLRTSPIARRNLSSLEQIERQEIIDTLQSVGGNKVRAAVRLNMARSTLYRKIDAFGIGDV